MTSTIYIQNFHHKTFRLETTIWQTATVTPVCREWLQLNCVWPTKLSSTIKWFNDVEITRIFHRKKLGTFIKKHRTEQFFKLTFTTTASRETNCPIIWRISQNFCVTWITENILWHLLDKVQFLTQKQVEWSATLTETVWNTSLLYLSLSTAVKPDWCLIDSISWRTPN